MKRLTVGIARALTALTLGGCGEIPLHTSTLYEEVAKKQETLVIGQTERSKVRLALGAPLVSSEFWRFDVFKATDSSTTLFLVFAMPLPEVVTDTAYFLVSYGDDHRVAAFDSGILSGNLLLEAGSAGLAVSEANHVEYVFVAKSLRDQYLETATGAEKCTVFVSCQSNWTCTESLSVDDGERMALPGSIAIPSRSPDESGSYTVTPKNWLAPLSVGRGAHGIEVFTGQKSFASASFECAAGERLFVRIDEPLQVTKDMPTEFGEHPLLVYRNGVWLVPQEPGW